MSQHQVAAELAPHGVLRAAINMGNFLLVTGRTASGDPDGCSPDMARAIAAALGVPVQMDIGLIGAEPARAEKIDFTAAYVEIEATYLVPAGSPIKSIAEVDVKGNRIAVTARSAYDLWLERNIHNATLVRGNSQAEVIEIFLKEKMEALAGLRPGLVGEVEKIPGSRILNGQFSAVQQAIGTPKKNTAGAAYLKQFVEDAKKSGAVAALLVKHGTVGRLSVAPLV
jgi:polar amino acid transport system substrate-binding protein